jgi:hypothetical protein
LATQVIDAPHEQPVHPAPGVSVALIAVSPAANPAGHAVTGSTYAPGANPFVPAAGTQTAGGMQAGSSQSMWPLQSSSMPL